MNTVITALGFLAVTVIVGVAASLIGMRDAAEDAELEREQRQVWEDHVAAALGVANDGAGAHWGSAA